MMQYFVHLIQRILVAPLPCLFHSLTGLYCPGCGGTRAVVFLLTGHPVLSVIYHPIVMYVAVITAYIICRDLLSILSHGKVCSRAKLHLTYLWVALAIILVNFAVKNAALIFWGVNLMPLG